MDRRTFLAGVSFVTTMLLIGGLTAGTAYAKKAHWKRSKCLRRKLCDIVAPTVTITVPAPGSTVTGRLPVQGVASDNVGVVSVRLQVDGGPFNLMSGTTSWNGSLDTVGEPNGSHILTARAVDRAGNAGTMALTVIVANETPAPDPSPDPAPSPAPSVGPQPEISCPLGALGLAPGADIQAAVDASPGGTDFCLQAGTWNLTSPIKPKTGDSFTGVYGATLDGSAIQQTADQSQGIFRARNQDIDDVIIRNLILRHGPAAINAFKDFSDGWVIDHNEVTRTFNGVQVGDTFMVSNNHIHHNQRDPANDDPALRGGGYGGFRSVGSLFVGNEIAYNGPEQKMAGGGGIVFLNNLVHHNYADGIWLDWAGTGNVVQGNTVTDNGREGIFVEGHTFGTVVRNTLSERNGGHGLFISGASGTDAYGNTFKDLRAVEMFKSGEFAFEDNRVHDNIFLTSGTAAVLIYPEQGNLFERNHYDVPDTAGRYWRASGTLKTWTEWRSLGQDTMGTVT